MVEASPIILSSPSAPLQHASFIPSSSSPSLPSPSELIPKHFPRRENTANNASKDQLSGSFVKASSIFPKDSASERGLSTISRTEQASKKLIRSTKSRDPQDPVSVDHDEGKISQISKPSADDHTQNGLISPEGNCEDATLLKQSNTRRKVVNKSAALSANDVGFGGGFSDPGKKRPMGASEKVRVKQSAPGKRTKAAPNVPKEKVYHRQTERVDDDSNTNDTALQLEAALKRRKGWTPPPEAAPLKSPIKIYDHSKPTQDVETSFRNISSFLSDYGCDAGSTFQPLPTTCVDGTTTKRRKVDLVSARNCPPSIPAKQQRAKSPKKKPQTITGKSTASFKLEETPGKTGLTQYFSLLTPDSSDHASKQPAAQHPKIAILNEKPVKKAKAPRKSSNKAKKSAVKKRPILLSPEDAIASANKQPVLFGTSSQLARDDSPTLLRDVRKAIAESELVEEGAEAVSEPGAEQNNNRVPQVPRGARNLWTAAARDSNNELQEVEISTRDRFDDTPDMVGLENASVSLDRQRGDEAWPPNDDNPQVPEPPEPDFGTSTLTLPRSLADASTKVRRSSVSPVKQSRKSLEVTAQMPNYSGFTHAQLRKEVNKFGFKPIRKREEMIALLQRCWESTHRTALQNLSPNKALRGTSSTIGQEGVENKIKEPKKRKARKREGPTELKLSDPISNVDDIAVPSKPRGRPRKQALNEQPLVESGSVPILDAPASQGALVSLKSAKAPGLLSDPVSPEVASKPLCQADPEKLFQKITEAVKGEPPTQDPNNLSFFERILIYQPIVIEDLTTWLNTKGLGIVGIDEEVASGLVKAWCEDRSVCCLWRENLRGGKRARH